MRLPSYLLLATFTLLLSGSGEVSAADTASLTSVADFGAEVMAVLSKAGCNQGACHGNQNGKGGFKLSLRGQIPRDDHRAIVKDLSGRRVDVLQPDQSLLLLKATSQVAHLGGRRFGRDSLEYAALRDWIARGAPVANTTAAPVRSIEAQPQDAVLVDPQQSVQLVVTATFADGTQRDVTRWVTYETTNLAAEVSASGLATRLKFGETTVIARYLDQQVPIALAFVPASLAQQASPVPASTRIDELVLAKLTRLGVQPSAQADDTTLVRRFYLDLLGVLPTAEEARDFVADMAPDKRERLVDRLLARAEFGELWALRWCDVLRVEEKVLDGRGVETFHGWIRDSLTLGKPIDEFVRDLVTSRGSTYANAPANYWRALRDPAGRGEATARLFLGVRLQCAQCHNHPFDRWTQDDYFNWTALFAKIDYRIVSNDRKDKLDLNEFDGEQVVEWTEKGDIKNPRTGGAAIPKFLGAAELGAANKAPLELLATWLTAPDNKLFARAQANFIWYHMMGRGLFEPIDDLRTTNPAANPPLLELLASDLAADGFDLRGAVRRIVTCETYGVSSIPNPSNRDDEANFARAIVRRLPAEVLLDAQAQFLDTPVPFSGYRVGLRAGQLPGVQKVRDRGKSLTSGDRFLQVFGKPQRLLGCECERSAETTLGQALSLLGDDGLQQRLAQSGNRLDRLVKSSLSPAEVVDEMYWTALNRPPTTEEIRTASAALETSTNRLETLQDLAWALLNAKEFLFRH